MYINQSVKNTNRLDRIKNLYICIYINVEYMLYIIFLGYVKINKYNIFENPNLFFNITFYLIYACFNYCNEE